MIGGEFCQTCCKIPLTRPLGRQCLWKLNLRLVKHYVCCKAHPKSTIYGTQHAGVHKSYIPQLLKVVRTVLSLTISTADFLPS